MAMVFSLRVSHKQAIKTPKENSVFLARCTGGLEFEEPLPLESQTVVLPAKEIFRKGSPKSVI